MKKRVFLSLDSIQEHKEKKGLINEKSRFKGTYRKRISSAV